ncbi:MULTISPECIES: uracil-DNA glycosylase [unclassified Apibacter]|uniref:uracil-DNA glycosylase n=1 Tax=unclassified Apibacter TaxID=2630820 RepID=UPI0013291B00|nr:MULTISPECIES: uracil-DNA glycosylase [unclassified Apibacter]MCX8676789.1 uracil-DNA glycosylase [Apibacter sp. B3919]MXO24828.1 uracil-DNA glycosylase [Apibacter sp. B3924]MXO26072.1 uracil-DNA glycosylase [Apibacter sp. B3813]MXO28023.1 uracil-DNA glycosylase [Apibacter sp. B3913]MXO29617.1 uracil-DNA glycosylase [Apibacter sp. B3912]
MNINIEESWKNLLKSEFEKPYFSSLINFVKQEYKEHTCYPKGKNIFKAFELTPFDQVKVVLLGQDPYHGEGQAMGLCFSVPNGMPYPPSLRNIIIELKNDTGIELKSGDLTPWAKQGVFLLNATLTVRAHQAGSHQKKGWETFTDSVIHKISEEKEHVVFILWGSYAQQKINLIDTRKHFIIKSVHPSPLSAHRGFFGSRPFSLTNEYLTSKKIEPIQW